MLLRPRAPNSLLDFALVVPNNCLYAPPAAAPLETCRLETERRRRQTEALSLFNVYVRDGCVCVLRAALAVAAARPKFSKSTESINFWPAPEPRVACSASCVLPSAFCLCLCRLLCGLFISCLLCCRARASLLQCSSSTLSISCSISQRTKSSCKYEYEYKSSERRRSEGTREYRRVALRVADGVFSVTARSR